MASRLDTSWTAMVELTPILINGASTSTSPSFNASATTERTESIIEDKSTTVCEAEGARGAGMGMGMGAGAGRGAAAPPAAPRRRTCLWPRRAPGAAVGAAPKTIEEPTPSAVATLVSSGISRARNSTSSSSVG